MLDGSGGEPVCANVGFGADRVRGGCSGQFWAGLHAEVRYISTKNRPLKRLKGDFAGGAMISPLDSEPSSSGGVSLQ